MTLDATIDRTVTEPASMPWLPAGQKLRQSPDRRVDRLIAELGRQEKIMGETSIVAERLRSLSVLVRRALTDEPASLDSSAVVEQAEAVWLIVDCLDTLAERHADASRREALAEVAR